MNDTRYPAVRHAWFDASRAPLYVWTFPVHIDDATLEDAIAAHRDWRGVAAFPCAFVVDLSQLRHATARQRWMVARHMLDATDHSRRYVVATAVVVPTAFHRALASAVFWIQRPPTPVHVATIFDEAMHYCEQRLVVAERQGARAP